MIDLAVAGRRRRHQVSSPPAGSIDDHQVLAYDLAHAAVGGRDGAGHARLRRQGRRRGAGSPARSWPTRSHDLAAKLFGREAEWGVEPGALDDARAVPRHLPRRRRSWPPRPTPTAPATSTDDFELVQDTFRRFADEKLKPVAEHIHRDNADIPEEIIAGLAEMGAFGLSVPEEYGGFARAARASTSAWSSPPRSCRAARSASAARSSPGPRS